MRAPVPKNAMKVGMSASDLRWELNKLVNDFPGDQQKLARGLGEMVVALIAKNNAELAKTLAARDAREEEGHR